MHTAQQTLMSAITQKFKTESDATEFLLV